jgi:crotonobetainyl-CoA:carnitine CoA-transferase CaiB-like acyl-CoA transferase
MAIRSGRRCGADDRFGGCTEKGMVRMTSGHRGDDVSTVLPLAGIRVIDMTHNVAGPYCTMMLGDLGAEVVKIESPGGDELRQLMPFPQRPPDAEDLFGMFNRNKRSIALDLKTGRGKDVLRRLIGKGDIFIQNLAPGAAARLGFAWDDVRVLNPRIVYVNISGFGPDDERRAYDGVIQAASGLMDITGFPDGPPLLTGIPIGDLSTSLFSAFSAVSALRLVKQTGRAVRIDVAMLDALMALHGGGAAAYLASAEHISRMGNEYPHRAPSNVYLTADDRYVLLVTSNLIWPRLCRALELDGLERKSEFLTNHNRVAHRTELNAYLQNRIREIPCEELCARLLDSDVPHSIVATIPEALDSTYAAKHGMVLEIDGPLREDRARLRVMGFPYKMNEAQATVRYGPPRLGEANDYVLHDLLGLPDDY